MVLLASSQPRRIAANPERNEPMINKALIPAPALALAIAAASVALPAAAQSYHGPAYHGPARPGPAHQVGYGGWRSIDARQAELDRRIDQGVRAGQINRREAARLRGEFSSLQRLEANYRRGGLTAWERADLDRRFDRLSSQIRDARYDRARHRG